MVSIALCGAMEAEPCPEDHENLAVEPTEPEVTDAISEFADRDGLTELPCGPAEESQELCQKQQAETESCAEESKTTEIKSPNDAVQETTGTECKEHRKLKKTNSWKMVRFQDPSTEEEILERDSSSESLFPEYATEEWTSSTFEELFMKEDWQDITGRPDSASRYYR